MRIFIVSNIFAPEHEGGAEKVARRAAELLSPSHDVCVLTTGREPGVYLQGGYAVERLKYHNLYPYAVGQPSVGKMLKIIWHFRDSVGGVALADLDRVLSDRPPDIVYMHNAMAFQPQLGKLCFERNIPVVAHLHDYSMMCLKTSMYRRGINCTNPCWDCRASRLLTQRVLKNVPCMIAVSEFVRDQHLKNGIGRCAQWHVLSNVEAKEVYVPRWKRSFGEDGSLIFGYLGALSPAKGIEDLVDAFLTLKKGAGHLLIAGKGNQSFVEPLKARTMGENVTWLGHVAPDDFYNKIDCLVVPSRWHEPQGLVVVEGINRGIPLIAADRGGISGVVRRYGAGRLYDPDKPGALRKIMVDFSRSRRIEWSDVILDEFPALREGGQLTEKKSMYFKQLTNILENCAVPRKT